MQLLQLELRNFRNHEASSFSFGSGTNIFVGENGQGKTNVIEAIAYLCLTKSFYASGDAYVLQLDKEMFELEGIILSEGGIEYQIRAAFDQTQNEKLFLINRQPVGALSSVIGQFPVVIFSPEHTPVTTGGPGERRKFIDFVISQASALYFQDLLEYRRVIRHRNKILLDARLARRDPSDQLGAWDEQLIKLGAALTQRRRKFINEFRSYIHETYHQLVGSEEEPAIEYQPMLSIDGIDSDDIGGIEESLRRELRERFTDERRLGTSIVGPHRDEIQLTINGLDLRKYASQGQHKTFLVALKMGEFFYLKDRRNETPLLLLDDVFTELDENRSRRLLTYVEGLSQTFITSTNPHLFDEHLHSSGGDNRSFMIENGQTRDARSTEEVSL